MSPDAAEIFAQVNGALLIAFAVEAKGLPEPSSENQVAHKETATLYAIGLFGVFLSLAVTLTSVQYDKDLGEWPARIATTGTFMGCAALYNESVKQLTDRARGSRKLRLAALIMAAGMVWFVIWVMGFVPDLFIWNWF